MNPYFRNKFAGLVAAIVVIGLLAGCGGGGGGGGSTTSSTSGGTAPPLSTLVVSSTISGSNVMPIYVDSGISGRDVNRLYADVRICQPGSSTVCQTIPHVLVDTGSNGLRLLYSALNTSMRTLVDSTRIAAGSGFPLLNCAQFADSSYAWGPMSTADVHMGGETAPNVPLQVVGHPTFNANVPTACGYQGTAINTAADLGANGIIGVGQLEHDCFDQTQCTGSISNGYYYTCPNAQCSGSAIGSVAPLAKQLLNPVRGLPVNNNGVLVSLPAVPSAGAAAMFGSLVFGVGTQSNNQIAGTGGSFFTTPSLYINTALFGNVMSFSFIDTGSNGTYFGTSFLPVCGGGYFYCPGALTTLTGSMSGQASAYIPSVNFSVDSIYRMALNPVSPTLAGPFSSSTFDWGLPFFFGKKVFIGITGQSTPMGVGPVYGF